MLSFNRWRRSQATVARRIARAAIGKLPREVQLEVTAALRDYIDPPPRSPATAAPRYVFVVKAGKILTFNAIREVAWARPDLLGVTFDRRWMGDRRLQQRSGQAERRQRQRRSESLDSDWLRRGFVLSIAAAPRDERAPAAADRKGQRLEERIAVRADGLHAHRCGSCEAVWRHEGPCLEPELTGCRDCVTPMAAAGSSTVESRSAVPVAEAASEPVAVGPLAIPMAIASARLAAEPIDAGHEPDEVIPAAVDLPSAAAPAAGVTTAPAYLDVAVAPVAASVPREAEPRLDDVALEPVAIPPVVVAGEAPELTAADEGPAETEPAPVAAVASVEVEAVVAPVAASVPSEAEPPPAEVALEPVVVAPAEVSAVAIEPAVSPVAPEPEPVTVPVEVEFEVESGADEAVHRPAEVLVEPIAVAPVLAEPEPVAAATESAEMARPPIERAPSVDRETVPLEVVTAAAAVAPVSAGKAPAPVGGAAKRPIRSHVHRCRRCGYQSRHTGTCVITTVTDLLPCPVCDAVLSHRPRSRRALVTAIAGLALLPVLWWLDAVPWSSDRMARVLSDLRESVDVGLGRSPSTGDRATTGSTAFRSSDAPTAPTVEPRGQKTANEAAPSESGSAQSQPSPLDRVPPTGSQTARVDTEASQAASVAPPERPAAPSPPAAPQERTASPPAEVPRPPSKPELPRRAPPPDSKLAESQRAPAGGSAGTTSSGVTATPLGRPQFPASSSGPALARPVPGIEDRPQALPPPPAPPSGPAIAAAPAPAPPAPASSAPASPTPQPTVPAPARSVEPAPPSPSSGERGPAATAPSVAAPPPSESPVAVPPAGGRAVPSSPTRPVGEKPPGEPTVAEVPRSVPSREPSAEKPPLGVRGAPPPGSPGGPFAMLAPAQTPGRGPGSLPDGGTGAGQTPAASRPRRAETAPAMVRILAVPGDPGRPAPPRTGQPAAQRGLGFLVDGRGYVLTHSDVIRDGKGLEAALADGRTFAVKQVWRDPLAGVAVLRIDGRDLPALPLGDSNGLHVGDPAAVVGWPAPSAAPPISATIRATGAATGGNLAIDAPIQAENVGGPLINARGQVVGIASADAHFMDGSSRGFAVPIDRAKSMLREAQASAAPARPTFTSGR